MFRQVLIEVLSKTWRVLVLVQAKTWQVLVQVMDKTCNVSIQVLSYGQTAENNVLKEKCHIE